MIFTHRTLSEVRFDMMMESALEAKREQLKLVSLKERLNGNRITDNRKRVIES